MRTLQSNVVFRHLETSDKRIVIEQGGTRSGKTYNILIWIIFSYALKNSGKTVTICRKTYPALRTSAMRDFIEILRSYELYDEKNHNKSSSEYHLNGNLIEFISLDQPQKVRGRKRDLLFINEANELHWEDWQQLVFRTTGRIIIDYNPSDEFHWIYERVKTRDDAEFHITTYKNNPFLEDSIIKEIELLKQTDENYWRVYGLGQVGSGKSLIFRTELIDKIPDNARFISYGMDFGYTNDPTTLIAIYTHDTNLYFDEKIYRTNMTNQDIANELGRLEIGRRDEIYADSGEPKSIEEIYRMGWNIKPATKGRDSVNIGIDMLKRYALHVTKESTNTIKEFRNYKWKEDKNGVVLNTPVDMFNHSIDAIRYGCYTKLSRPNYGQYAVR
jgi:phage terminase large subunit